MYQEVKQQQLMAYIGGEDNVYFLLEAPRLIRWGDRSTELETVLSSLNVH